MVLVKICGITNLSDALASIEAGADALGFNFYRSSPRYIHPLEALRIVERLPTVILTVGVFVNEGEPEDVARIAVQAGVGALQLHGDESPEYCRALEGMFVIKALRPAEGFEPESAAGYPATAIMLDSYVPGIPGGSGQTLNWDLARRTKDKVSKLLIAGGLSHNNVAAAISVVDPYGVDACSLLERSLGQKDHQLIEKFVKSAKDAG